MLLANPAHAAGRGVVMLHLDGVQTPLYGSSHALLVGNSDYTAGWPDLESVPRELERVERVLKAQGFQVDKRLNLKADDMKDAFEQFIAAHGYDSENRLLFYYSGHGHTWEEVGQGYLVPADAPLPASATGNPGREFLRKALHMSQVLAWSRQMTAKHGLFLFDSCFSGTIFKTKSLPGKPPHITRATALKVRQFITAGSAGEQVPARSVFTPAFVDALELGWGDLNKDGYVSGVELGLYLQTKVPEHAAQTPQFGKHPDYALSRGDFVLETKVAAVSPPASGASSAGDAAKPAAAPVVPPPPPPVQFSGNVQINANVPATVYLDGRRAGTTQPGRPLNEQGVPAGPLVVRVEAEGHEPMEQRVQVRRGQWEQLVFELQPRTRMARLTVRSNVYEDQVYIDGSPRGSTRLDVELEPGRHVVVVEKDGYKPFERQVQLEAGAAVVLRARLEPIRSAPPPRPGPVEDARLESRRACELECQMVMEHCEQELAAALESGSEECRAEAAARCEHVYDRCRSAGTIVGGEVSVESECLGEQYRCEREQQRRCQEGATQGMMRCDQRVQECLLSCPR
ncbi:MAG: PEGA domain-containing protein [Gammaproteobacteria bacterium]|nr:PEGA domain-containing protein [Gammaproteobacteria bacterium]